MSIKLFLGPRTTTRTIGELTRLRAQSRVGGLVGQGTFNVRFAVGEGENKRIDQVLRDAGILGYTMDPAEDRRLAESALRCAVGVVIANPSWLQNAGMIGGAGGSFVELVVEGEEGKATAVATTRSLLLQLGGERAAEQKPTKNSEKDVKLPGFWGRIWIRTISETFDSWKVGLALGEFVFGLMAFCHMIFGVPLGVVLYSFVGILNYFGSRLFGKYVNDFNGAGIAFPIHQAFSREQMRQMRVFLIKNGLGNGIKLCQQREADRWGFLEPKKIALAKRALRALLERNEQFYADRGLEFSGEVRVEIDDRKNQAAFFVCVSAVQLQISGEVPLLYLKCRLS